MKRLIAAFLLFGIVFSLAVCGTLTVGRCHNLLLSDLDRYYQTKESREPLASLKKDWDKAQPILMFFTNHQSVNDIDITVNRILQYEKNGQKDEINTEIAELKARLNHLKNSESFSFETIF
jgi:hypothetical protein